MIPRNRILVTWAILAASVHLSACSSRFRNSNEADSSAEGAAGSITSDGSGGTGGSSTVSGIPTGSFDGSGGATGANTGGSGGTGTGGSGSTGADGSAGESPGGSAGTGGSPVMNCEPTEPNCTCDASGCFLEPGAECTRGTDCKTQICGVTQAAASVCCSEACDDDQVCSDDGDGCEAADACEEALERCSGEGDHQRCSGGQWETQTECNGLGCSLELTDGCLSPLGTACVESDECGEGTCQETADGGSVCCDASCGDCQVCTLEGTACAEPSEVKPGCNCTDDDLSNCDDNLACTVDTCQEGRCSNELDSGYCLIDDQCYEHNQPEAGNTCRYCDAALRDRAWTNSANTVSCDDGAWCNGEDTCNGTGQCQHEYPTLARCTESGPCALTTCDEERDSCYRPDDYECSIVNEDRCQPPSSVAKCPTLDVQRRTTTTYCSGTSIDCAGDVVISGYQTLHACSTPLNCDSDTFTCEPVLGCGDTRCDQDTGLCWTLTEPSAMSLPDAHEYCTGLDAGGSNPWRLPTIDEWLQFAKGCDEATGESQTNTFQSTCSFDRETDDPEAPCTSSCPDGEGPTSGCYWPVIGGECAAVAYWSSTAVTTGRLLFDATSNWVVFDSDVNSNQAVRCVTETTE